MTMISAKITTSGPSPSARRHVVFVTYPGITLLDLTGPLQAFNDAGLMESSHGAGYDVTVASVDGGKVPSNTVLSVDTVAMGSLDPRSIHTMIVVGGRGVHDAVNRPELMSTVQQWGGKVQRIASVCSGAFVLAAAGFLDGKRAVTHWSRCKQLKAEYPSVMVEQDPIYLQDGNVWTSAGVTAGIDLSLALIAQDLGRSLAMDVARNLVAYMVRPGGQSQFSSILAAQTKDSDGTFKELHDWVAQNLDRDLRVDALAVQANMSSRNFARVYTEKMGQTPAKMVETRRVHAACVRLESTDENVALIADGCGFGNAERMRRSFLRIVGVAPSDYRVRFQKGDLTA